MLRCLVFLSACTTSTPPSTPVPASCPSDVSSIGRPVGKQEFHDGFLVVAASQDGCTIATRDFHQLVVSWDAGKTFSTMTIEVAWFAVADGRVVVLRKDGLLGTFTPMRGPVWRTVPVTPTRVFAAGNDTVVVQVDPPKIAYSSDEGQHWSALSSPVQSIGDASLDRKGVLTISEPIHGPVVPGSGCDPEVIGWKRFDSSLAKPHWITTPTPAWSYEESSEHTCDHFSHSFVVAIRDGKSTNVSGMHRVQVDGPIWVEGNYGMWDGALYRLRDGVAEKAAAVPFVSLEPGVVDGNGNLLATSGAMLVRWSPRGGWRILFP